MKFNCYYNLTSEIFITIHTYKNKSSWEKKLIVAQLKLQNYLFSILGQQWDISERNI